MSTEGWPGGTSGGNGWSGWMPADRSKKKGPKMPWKTIIMLVLLAALVIVWVAF